MNVEDAYFRGRKLQGATLPIPPGHSAFALGKKIVNKRKASDMSEQNSWEIKATFENVTYWNNDSLSSQDDAFVRSFHWLSLAKALHKPVTAEALASASLALEKKLGHEELLNTFFSLSSHSESNQWIAELHKPVTAEALASASLAMEKK